MKITPGKLIITEDEVFITAFTFNSDDEDDPELPTITKAKREAIKWGIKRLHKALREESKV